MQKIIGVIGGVSFESTVLYYKLINEMTKEKQGGLHSAEMLIRSLNYAPIIDLERQNKWNEVGNYLRKTAENLEKSGAEIIILACNTLHKVSSFIEANLKIPFLHIADAAGRALSNTHAKNIALLGTQFTMEDGFYSKRLMEKFGLNTILPEKNERIKMDSIIYDELCLGKVLTGSQVIMKDIINNLEQKGADAVLLACTELGMLMSSVDVRLPMYDTTFLHAKETVALSFY